MNIEILKYFKNPFYWIILGFGLGVRIIIAHFDRLYRIKDFWLLAADFWNTNGSLTVGFLIIIVMIHQFSLDRECQTSSTINSTTYGRIHLFRARITAGCMATSFATVILAVSNFTVSRLFSLDFSCPQNWMNSFFISSMVATGGSICFFVYAAFICDIFKNQSVAMCVCGAPFAISYFVNASAIEQYELSWFFRYGFFTELMRGRLICSVPKFWMIWYVLLFGGVLLVTINKRKERKEF